MGSIIDKISDWLHELLVEGVLENLTGMISAVNEEVGSVASDVSQTPAQFSPGVFSMIRTISDTVILPIAGIILTIIACWELIQMVTEHNNLQNFETWVIFKWIFKTFVAVTIISHDNVILPFVDKFPTDIELYRIMTTKLNEVSEYEEIKD